VAKNVDTLKQRGKSKKRGFTLAEVGKLLKRCDEAGGEWCGLVLTGLYTGQRLGDVAGLTWQQVDLSKGCVSFFTNKTDKRLSFYLAKPLADYLESIPSSDQPDAFVFPKAAAMAEKHTGTISTKFYDEILAPAGLVKVRPKAKAKIGGKGRDAKRQTSELSFHSLRHTLVKVAFGLGASTGRY
jgi:integrase